jgi:hypothetical protein
MPATKEHPKSNDNLYVFIDNKKYSMANTNDLKNLSSTSSKGRRSFLFYFTGKSKNETQSTILTIARVMSAQGRTPIINIYTDGSVSASMLDRMKKEWYSLIKNATEQIKTDKLKAEQSSKEKKK